MPTVRLHPPPAASRVRNATVAGPARRVRGSRYRRRVHTPVSGWLRRRCISAQMPGASAVTWPNSPKRRSPAESTSSSSATKARKESSDSGLWRRAKLEALEVLADAARRHDALLAVNDRADIAVAARADVLHLGQDDLPLSIARDIIGPRPVIGRSTHDHRQVTAAVEESVDYFCVGPCWPTPTKPGRPAPGLDLVRATAELATPKPWFAIGGIDEERLPEVLEAGARRRSWSYGVRSPRCRRPGGQPSRLKARLVEAG